MNSRTVRFITMGCQMNVYDSQRMMENLSQFGFRIVDKPQDAALVVVNTCSVRDKPVEKLFSALGRLRKLRNQEGYPRIVVAGCVARQLGRKILGRSPWVDVVMGPDHICQIGELLQQRELSGDPVVATEYLEQGGFSPRIGQPPVTPQASAFVSIIKGCNQFCSYCIVPTVRGPEHSKPLDSVLHECQTLLDNGATEITLLGQNVNKYSDQNGATSFPQLLTMVHNLPGLKRLRFVTSHPAQVDDALISRFAELPKLASHFHLPVQSGSNTILDSMNRGYTAEHYRSVVSRLRQARPDIVVTSDFVVGFCGETDQDFQATLALAQEIRFGMAYVFKYNPRPGTRAAAWKDDVPEEVKQKRLEMLVELIEQTMAQAMNAHVGREEAILIEGQASTLHAGRRYRQWFGRTSTNFVVNIDGPETPHTVGVGQLADVRILQSGAHSLVGEWV